VKISRLKTVSFLSILFLLSSCAGSILPTKKPKPEEKIESYSEDISIFLPVFESPKNTESEKKTSQKTNQEPTENVQIASQTEEVNKILSKIAENNKLAANGNGYRVQVYIGNTKADFEAAKSFLFRNFSDYEVYESYSQPTYRLKMGDFLNINEAQTILEEVKARYSSARLVTEKINVKKAIENK
jgi:type III secretory pathway component EscV